MPSIILYHMIGSPPCRTINLLANHLGIKLNLKALSLREGEHLKEEYLRINPQHTVPTIKDGDFILWESRAIAIYLASAYGKDSDLYPEDPKTRAVINRLLFFDNEKLYKSFADYLFPVIILGATSFNNEKKEKLVEALNFLETFLSKHNFSAADHLTIADFSLAVSVTSIAVSDVVDLSEYKKINEWLERCRTQIKDFAEINDKDAEGFRGFVKERVAANLKM
ncbi:UNVERIFIED_CONTAM: hypothetical protein RMT77_002106 [Armadillidium vulgare]